MIKMFLMANWIYRVHMYAKCLRNVTIKEINKVHIYMRNVFNNTPKYHTWLDKFLDFVHLKSVFLLTFGYTMKF